MVVQDEINTHRSSMNQKPNSTMSVMNSCLIARLVSFDTTCLHLLTFRILEPYPSKCIAFDLSHVISH